MCLCVRPLGQLQRLPDPEAQVRVAAETKWKTRSQGLEGLCAGKPSVCELARTGQLLAVGMAVQHALVGPLKKGVL